MSSIPAALQVLDLPPDDEQVLAIFRSAASGWATSTLDDLDGHQSTGEGMISRDDWRSVCAVLLENYQEGDENGDEHSPPDERMQESDDGDDVGSDDQYRASETSDVDSDEDYVEDLGPSSSRRRTRGRPARSSSPSPPLDSPASNRPLTKRQQQVALEAFALFFPSIPRSELANQKIMLRDLQRTAKLLGEKIKADEVGHDGS